MDLLCSIVVLAIAVTAAVGVRGRQALHARVVAEGESAFMRAPTLQTLYNIVTVIGDACVNSGITANAITAFSLVAALFAALLIAFGHLGVGAFLMLLAAGSDALDGYVARGTGTADDSGELLDAAVDRYVEFAVFAGLAVHERESALALALVFTACAGSFMVSYSSAKAEALHVTPPSGGMRRTERLALLIIGVALTAPLALWVDPRWAEAPLFLVLAIIAAFAHTSAVLRFQHLMRALRGRGRAPVERPPEPIDLPVRDRSRG